MVGYANKTVFQYTINSINYTINYDALNYSPDKITVPDRSVEHTNPVSETWVGDYIEADYGVIQDPNKRALQYKFVGGKGSEVNRLTYNLKKSV
jgi:hypothetical protein